MNICYFQVWFGRFFLGGVVCLFICFIMNKAATNISYMSFWIYALNSLYLLISNYVYVSACWLFSCRHYLLAFHYRRWFFSISNTHSSSWHTFFFSTTLPFQCNMIWIRYISSISTIVLCKCYSELCHDCFLLLYISPLPADSVRIYKGY